MLHWMFCNVYYYYYRGGVCTCKRVLCVSKSTILWNNAWCNFKVSLFVLCRAFVFQAVPHVKHHFTVQMYIDATSCASHVVSFQGKFRKKQWLGPPIKILLIDNVSWCKHTRPQNTLVCIRVIALVSTISWWRDQEIHNKRFGEPWFGATAAVRAPLQKQT